ncbi:hypothetical protein ACFQ51_43330 [Streptomyces kaempferi]
MKANNNWLVETKKAHYIAVIKTNQPTAYAQIAALPWMSIKVQHTASATAHGRRESRSIKTCAIADNLGGIAFPHAHLAIRVHRRRKPTGRPKPARTSTRSPASPPIKPAPPTSPPPFAGTGESKIPPTTSEMSRSPRTPRPFTPAPHPAPWPPSATSPSAP